MCCVSPRLTRRLLGSNALRNGRTGRPSITMTNPVRPSAMATKTDTASAAVANIPDTCIRRMRSRHCPSALFDSSPQVNSPFPREDLKGQIAPDRNTLIARWPTSLSNKGGINKTALRFTTWPRTLVLRRLAQANSTAVLPRKAEVMLRRRADSPRSRWFTTPVSISLPKPSTADTSALNLSCTASAGTT